MMNTEHKISAFCAAVLLAGSTAWASGKIMTVKKESAGLDLKTWMIVGNTYQLQCSTNLVSGTWTDVGEELTATLTSTNYVVGTEAEQCWFRVVELTAEQSGPTSPPEPPPLSIPEPPASPPSFN